jgi:hypothetical protein
MFPQCWAAEPRSNRVVIMLSISRTAVDISVPTIKEEKAYARASWTVVDDEWGLMLWRWWMRVR